MPWPRWMPQIFDFKIRGHTCDSGLCFWVRLWCALCMMFGIRDDSAAGSSSEGSEGSMADFLNDALDSPLHAAVGARHTHPWSHPPTT